MRRPLAALACAALALAAAPAAAAPWDKPGYTVTFHDEFDGAALDLSAWGTRYKWGEAVINGELQAYVDDAFVFEGGLLRITATHAPGTYAGKTLDYRSGLIAFAHEQTYGYFEMRCRMPAGKGYWPAFWLLGANGTSGVNEIDIHEFLGDGPHTVYTTVHWGTDYGAGHHSDGASFDGPDFTADFHTFALDWDASSITWLVDGAPVFQHSGEGVPQVPMYLIANLAVGGGWPGAPDGSTVFPGHYDIDYIRAYQRATTDGGAGGGGGSGGSTAGTGGNGGSTATAGTGGGAGSTGRGGAGSTGSGTKEGGCGCRAAGEEARGAGWMTLLVAGAAGLGRRRRRAGAVRERRCREEPGRSRPC
jgi:MYXO-CTERM domain-containing protein